MSVGGKMVLTGDGKAITGVSIRVGERDISLTAAQRETFLRLWREQVEAESVAGRARSRVREFLLSLID